MTVRHGSPRLILSLLAIAILIVCRLLRETAQLLQPALHQDALSRRSDLISIGGKHKVIWSQDFPVDDDVISLVPSSNVTKVAHARKRMAASRLASGIRGRKRSRNLTAAKDGTRHSSKQKAIRRIYLIGERHSGTKYMTNMLQSCFSSLTVTDSFVRYKHWFQPSPKYVQDVANQYMLQGETFWTPRPHDATKKEWPRLAALKNTTKAFSDGLLVAMFRNPYDWMEAMRRGPHHWPNHMRYNKTTEPVPNKEEHMGFRRHSIAHEKKHSIGYRLEYGKVESHGRRLFWKRESPAVMRPGGNGNARFSAILFPWNDFVSANMTLPHDSEDEVPRLCQDGFLSGTVSPCRLSNNVYPPEVKSHFARLSDIPKGLIFSGHQPMYELNTETGKPFRHPLELRAAKIQNYLNLPHRWELGGFLTLTNEEIIRKGTGLFLDKVSKIVGLPPSCKARPPAKKASYQLDSEWSEWITQHADWDQEARLGYSPRTSIHR